MNFGILNNNSAHKCRQVNNVDGGDKILALSDDGEGFGVLDPRLLEVIVEDTLSITVTDTSAHHVDSEQGLRGGGRECERLKSLQVLVALVGNTKVEVRLLVKDWLLTHNGFSVLVNGSTLLLLFLITSLLFFFFLFLWLLLGSLFLFIAVLLGLGKLGGRVVPGHD